MKKIFLSIVLIILLITIPCTTIFAEDLGLGILDYYKGTNPESPTLQQKANNVLGVIQIVGVVVSVGALVLIGIKYMMGSVEDKAEYKQTLKPYIIGAFILFTGSVLPNIIYQFAQNI